MTTINSPILTSFHLKGIGGKKKRMSSKILRKRGIIGSHSRHESQDQINNDRLLRQYAKSGVETQDTPMPVIDIGIDKIDSLIKSVIDPRFEDAVQDAWAKILVDHPATHDEILAIAKEINRQHASQNIATKYQNISLDAPLTHNDGDNDLTLRDLLPANEERSDDEIDHDIEYNQPYVATNNGKPNIKGTCILDAESVERLRQLFPHDSVKAAVKKAIFLPNAERSRHAWYKWEDAIIKQRYPWGGAKAVALDICRPLPTIAARAKTLGVQHFNHGRACKPVNEWYNITETANILGVSRPTVSKWVSQQLIKCVSIPDYFKTQDGIFFMPQQIITFIQTYPIMLDMNKLAENYKSFIPTNHPWKTLPSISKTTGIPIYKLEELSRRKIIRTIKGNWGACYINEDEIVSYIQQPYPVVAYKSKRHYLFHSDTHGNHVLYCEKHTPANPLFHLTHVKQPWLFPTCLNCLKALRKMHNGDTTLSPKDVYKENKCLICEHPTNGESICQAHLDELEEERQRELSIMHDICNHQQEQTNKLNVKRYDVSKLKEQLKMAKATVKTKIQRIRVVKVKTKIQRIRVVRSMLPRSIDRRLESMLKHNYRGKTLKPKLAKLLDDIKDIRAKCDSQPVNP